MFEYKSIVKVITLSNTDGRKVAILSNKIDHIIGDRANECIIVTDNGTKHHFNMDFGELISKLYEVNK